MKKLIVFFMTAVLLILPLSNLSVAFAKDIMADSGISEALQAEIETASDTDELDVLLHFSGSTEYLDKKIIERLGLTELGETKMDAFRDIKKLEAFAAEHNTTANTIVDTYRHILNNSTEAEYRKGIGEEFLQKAIEDNGLTDYYVGDTRYGYRFKMPKTVFLTLAEKVTSEEYRISKEYTGKVVNTFLSYNEIDESWKLSSDFDYILKDKSPDDIIEIEVVLDDGIDKIEFNKQIEEEIKKRIGYSKEDLPLTTTKENADIIQKYLDTRCEVIDEMDFETQYRDILLNKMNIPEEDIIAVSNIEAAYAVLKIKVGDIYELAKSDYVINILVHSEMTTDDIPFDDPIIVPDPPKNGENQNNINGGTKLPNNGRLDIRSSAPTDTGSKATEVKAPVTKTGTNKNVNKNTFASDKVPNPKTGVNSVAVAIAISALALGGLLITSKKR
jgi:hypothetical protein